MYSDLCTEISLYLWGFRRYYIRRKRIGQRCKYTGGGGGRRRRLYTRIVRKERRAHRDEQQKQFSDDAGEIDLRACKVYIGGVY